jgi:hypothetical protein
MENFMTQSGIATTVVDFTREFSPLLIGLVGLLWVSIGALAVIAIRHYLIEKTRLIPRTESEAVEQRKAA